VADEIHTPTLQEQSTDRASGARTEAASDDEAQHGGEGPKALAFFDLDGTLVSGNTQALLVRFLRSARVISRRFVAYAVLWFIGYKLGLVKVSEEERAKSASMLTGLSIKEVDRAISQFVEAQLMPRLHPGALAALREHQETGDRVVILSAALDPVVRWLATDLGVRDFAGAPCEVVGGVYTGRLSGLSPHGQRKADLAMEFMQRFGVHADECWAYADHVSDEALLRSVGHPVAVRPKPGLEKLARAAGWPVLP
jgi:HAD superfamily hydrolase (TIGR01490 family)